MTAGDRIVVTGGAGRLGRSVVRVLAEAGYAVTSFDRSVAEDLPAEQRSVDLRDATATAAALREVSPRAVIHLAAIAVPGALPDAEVFDINTGLLWSVLEGSIAAGVSEFLVSSSPTVIGYGAPQGWEPTYLPLDEDHPVAPWNGYAVSKVAIEQIIAMAVRRSGQNTRFGVFRPCYVIAPEEWAGAQTQQGHTIADRLANPALSAVALFNYVDARDAGDFVAAWLEHAADVPNGEVFFVGAADALVTAPTATALSELVSGTATAATGLAGTDPVFSTARAERLLGWKPRRSWRSELSDQPTLAGQVPAPTTDSQEISHA